MTTDNVRNMVQRAGQEARLAFPIHPHMLRHACGYKLANEPGHAGDSAVSRTQKHTAHGEIHGTGTDAVQGLLEGLTAPLPDASGHYHFPNRPDNVLSTSALCWGALRRGPHHVHRDQSV